MDRARFLIFSSAVSCGPSDKLAESRPARLARLPVNASPRDVSWPNMEWDLVPSGEPAPTPRPLASSPVGPPKSLSNGELSPDIVLDTMLMGADSAAIAPVSIPPRESPAIFAHPSLSSSSSHHASFSASEPVKPPKTKARSPTAHAA